MTFLEAAIEILRRADGPLHFGEVARLAVDKNLLSHVGRDPEAAMQTCLNSAVRQGRDGAEPIIVRAKPGYYGLRPGASLPDPPPMPEPSPKPNNAKETAQSEDKPKARSKATKKRASTRKTASKAAGEEPKKRRRTRTKKGEAPAPESVAVLPTRKTGRRLKAKEPAPDAEPSTPPAAQADPPAASAEPADVEADDGKAVEFEAPSGSGLDGVTDVALVMANAMSRLVEERPELKEELEAMQTPAAPEPETPPRRPAASSAPSRAPAEPASEERGGRRRRRRRRRGKRVDWSAGEVRGRSGNLGDSLLDGVASVLEEAGSRSLHVRQIAETLAGKGILGGEISEIERAVTAAILLDIHRTGRASRFVARGDARYQLSGTRLPEPVAKAEQGLRDAARLLERESDAQLLQWLQSLGARALESLVRIYLQREGYTLLSALPPSRGLGKLVVDDAEPDDDDPRTLVLVVPRRTAVDAKLWEGELERHSCSHLLLIAMGDPAEEGVTPPASRLIGATELAAWLKHHRLGISTIELAVPVLDPTLIESIGGLDT